MRVKTRARIRAKGRPVVKQLIFDLPVKTAFGRADFFVSDSNETAVKMLTRVGADAPVALILVGESGAGKSHLARIWADDCGARVINCADLAGADLAILSESRVCVEDCGAMSPASETALFHLYNLMMEAGMGTRLLLTSAIPLRDWAIGIPDLQSRLQSAGFARVAPPDDQLLAMIMLKQFDDRQILIEPKVLDYILSRMERSFAMVARLVQEMDKMALGQGKPIGQKNRTGGFNKGKL